MTNPDHEELVKLADELIAQNYGNVCDADAMEEHFVLLAKAATALRRLSSSDGAVKVRELAWDRKIGADDYFYAATGIGEYRAWMHWSTACEWFWKVGDQQENGPFINAIEAKAAAQADYEARIRSALVGVPAVKGEPEPVADWRDDPTSDERWNAGCDFAMEQLCKALDVDPETVNWDAATETVDGDVQSVIWNILRTRMGENWSPDTAPPADAGMREALEPFASAAKNAAWPTFESDNTLVNDSFGLTVGNLRRASAALTAPGATTKSDGVRWGDSGPIPGQHFGDEFAAEPSPSDPFAGKVPCHCHDAVSQRLCFDKDRCYTVEAQPVQAIKMPEYRYQEPDPRGGNVSFGNYSEYTPVTVRGSTTVPTLVDDPNSASGKRVEYQRPSDPSSTRSDVTVEIKHLISSARAFLAHFNPCDLAEDKSQQWQSLEHQCNRAERALLDQFEIRRK